MVFFKTDVCGIGNRFCKHLHGGIDRAVARCRAGDLISPHFEGYGGGRDHAVPGYDRELAEPDHRLALHCHDRIGNRHEIGVADPLS